MKYAIAILLVTALMIPIYGSQTDTSVEIPTFPQADEALPYSKKAVEYLIEHAAREYEVERDAAIRIARCESGFKWNAANTSSSAKGVYQFLDGTWAAIRAEGHQFDVKENIKQFMIYYPSNPGWWVCK